MIRIRIVSTFLLAIALESAIASTWADVQSPAVQELAGTASVIDGDTIEIHGTRIRLNGFDAPEQGSVCEKTNVYQKASLALSDFIGTRTVTCSLSGKDRHKRSIGVCFAGGESLAGHMVESGWGRDWPRYSEGMYADEEKRARSAKSGIWGLACLDDLWGDRNYD